MSSNPATITAATWAAVPTQTVTADSLGPGDVVYLGDGPAPVRIRHVDNQPDGRVTVWASPALSLAGLVHVEAMGTFNPTTQVRQAVL